MKSLNQLYLAAFLNWFNVDSLQCNGFTNILLKPKESIQFFFNSILTLSLNNNFVQSWMYMFIKNAWIANWVLLT